MGPENPFGLDRRDVMLRMVDDDLWIVPPELHYEFEEEKTVLQWKYTLRLMNISGTSHRPLNCLRKPRRRSYRPHSHRPKTLTGE